MPETDYSVRTFKGGYDDNLTYLVTCMRTGNQFLVDAAVPLKQIDSYMSKKGLIALFITHTHGDHTAYMDEYVEAFPNLITMIYKDSENKVKSTLKRPVKHGDIVTVGQLSLEILHTPGHYSDSVCYYLTVYYLPVILFSLAVPAEQSVQVVIRVSSIVQFMI